MQTEQAKPAAEAEVSALTDKQHYWLEKIKEAVAPDQSLSDYARAHDHNPQRLYEYQHLLYWEGSGFVLWHKKLEQARFYPPRQQSDEVIMLTGQQLNWLLSGYDLAQLKPHQKLRYSSVL